MRISSSAISFLLASRQTAAFGSRSLSSAFRPSPPLAKRNWFPAALALDLAPTNNKYAMLSTRGGSTSTDEAAVSKTCLNSAVATDVEPSAPVENFRLDYKPLPHLVTEIQMDFDIRENKTTVTSKLTIKKNGDVKSGNLVLDGEEESISLMSLSLNGKSLIEGTDYELKPGKLILKDEVLSQSKDGNILTTVVEIVPEENTQLSGLYKSGPMYCTQCEAMGFRRITYYPDRPDNMAVFSKIRLEADDSYPVLLSNGNLVEEGVVEGDSGRKFSVWTDPFPKPSYLFALVAGSLGSIKDKYITSSGKEVHLEIFSEAENVNKLDYAMESLKASMKWDEDTFGLEYDLGIYNVVAVNDFNMGAMENKGLNVFNTAYVLADPTTASDTDYERVEGVIGHEYFHNWTGNRVTCRDWFQLTLKEGLTVFRDQEFSGDMGSKAVKRIESVRGLRAGQFAEDAGPMSHPIRPESYISMDNFYTATVYSKGAEVIRMYNTLLSTEGFRKGMDLYFERHDGSGVTCDDFRAAMADANNVDLSQFGLWYSTSGTPTVTYAHTYNDEEGIFSLTLTQSSNSDKPLHIPISTGLLNASTGEEVVPTTVLELKEKTQTFEFKDLKEDVVPSLLRDFSAPVKLIPESGDVDEEALAFLAARDTDGFNRWEAGQKLFTLLCFQSLNNGEMNQQTLDRVLEAFGRTLENEDMDSSIKAYALTLPAESTLAEELETVDPAALRKAKGEVKLSIARKFKEEILSKYEDLTAQMEAEGGKFKVDASSVGRRRLRNTLLSYLTSIKESPEEQREAADLAMAQFNAATGMTDKIAALSALASMDGEGTEARDEALKRFYEDANGDALVLNKWFSVQAMADLPDVLDRVKALTKHPDFTLSNPNRCRSLISAFTGNLAPFHSEDGEGYKFVADTIIELDRLNPQISSRIAKTLIQWRKYGEKRGALMKNELNTLKDQKLSDDLFEVVTTGLK